MTRTNLIEWSPEYSVGVRLFDQQHHRLMNLINELHDAAQAGSSKLASEHVLLELVAYTKTHFAAEEHAMREHGYPEFEHHKREHDRMITRVQGYQREVVAGPPAASLNLSFVLADWWWTPNRQTDKPYATFLGQRGVK